MALLAGLILAHVLRPPEVRLISVDPEDAALSATESLIPINEASAEELLRLPSIGPKRAADIVADRELNGPYSSVDSLQRVHGIGPVTVDRIRQFVRVE